MDFSFTQRQQELWNDTVAFARDELQWDDLPQRDEQKIFIDENWQKIAKKGLLGLSMPEAYGGCGYDMVTTIHMLEALGYGCPDNGLTLAVNGQTWSIQHPIANSGTEAQRRKYLPGLIDGSIKGCHAMTEPESGSDAFNMATVAEKTDGGYCLNGKKVWVGMAPEADIVMVFASTNPDVGAWGVSAFIMEAGSPGLTLEATPEKMGLRTEPFGSVIMENVFVPEENRIGREGAGASLFNAGMSYERNFIFTSHIGSMARQLDQTIEYAKNRKQSGQPIGKYQSVSNRIADMRVRLETARLFLYKAAAMIDAGQDVSLHAAMTKLALSEIFVENSMDAIRIHGARGYMAATGVERDLRDAIGGVIYAGTSDIQRNLIARMLGL
ncbi:MAG: acyl-CoA dehydrogenase family protein [Chloroflexota bacterium]